MLTASYSPGTSFSVPFYAAVQRIQRWLDLSRRRRTCDDAYSDLLLAAVEFGALNALVHAEPRALVRQAMAADANQLMTELLLFSHSLREACRVPL